MLDETADFLGEDWPERLPAREHYYAFRVLATRITLLDFLGYKEKCLAAQRTLIRTQVAEPQVERSRLVVRINHLRDLSQWEGASGKILDEARAIALGIKEGREDSRTDLLISKMEFDLENRRETADAMEAQRRKIGDLDDETASSYAERDSLEAQSELGVEGLDPRYSELLGRLRKQGNKRGEPTVYRNYGNYLLKLGRNAEAAGMLAEALRLSRSFGWELHEPALIGCMFWTRYESGDTEGARVSLDELVEWVSLHLGAPAQRVAYAHSLRANMLASMRETEAARAAYAQAREIGEGKVALSAGDEVGTVSVPLRLFSGEGKEIVLTMAAGRPDDAGVSVRWKSGLADTGAVSAWQISWEESATGRTVLDASGLGANPFKSVAIRHQLSVPIGESVGVPLRLRSPAELRFEYYDGSGRLVGVDANGNGDFTETGDFHSGGPEGGRSAVFPASPGASQLTASVLVFAPDGKPLAFLAEPLVIVVETFRDGAWIKESEDVLK